MTEQLLRLVFGGHQHQPPLAVDAGLQPGPWSQAKGIAQRPGDGELTRGGEGDGVHGAIVRRIALLLIASAWAEVVDGSFRACAVGADIHSVADNLEELYHQVLLAL